MLFAVRFTKRITEFHGKEAFADTKAMMIEMKYRLIAIFCALLISLTACEQTDLPDTADTSAADTADTSVRDTAAAPVPITDEEIYALLGGAEEIYALMSFGSLDTDPEASGVIVDGSQFYPVRDYETKAELTEYLRQFFTQSKAESMTLGYRDIDGRLHTVPSDRGTNIRARGWEYEIERVDDTAVKITRYVGVWETKECGDRTWGITYNVGKSPTELMLVWDSDRWVFDSFAVWDNLRAYDDGGGVHYEYAEGITDAIIKRDTEVSADDSGEYGYLTSVDVGNFRENTDGSVTATLYAKAIGKSESKYAEHDYTFVKSPDGTWDFENTGYDLPERMFEAGYTTAPFFDELTDAEIPSLDDIERLISHADLIWNAFYTVSMKTADGKDDIAFSDGIAYRAARDYKTVGELRARLLECFSESLTESALEYALSEPLAEIDGRLYVKPMARCTDLRAGKVRLTAEKLSDTELAVTRWIEVSEYDEGADGFVPVGESPQELTLIYENGHWVFDSFTVSDDLSAYDNGSGTVYGKESDDGHVYTDQYPDTAPQFDVLTAPEVPSEEDIMRVFDHADLIWSALDLGLISAVYDKSQAKEFEGLTFYPVRDYETVDDLRARLRECFTESFTERLIDNWVGGADEAKAFYEVGGKLYTAGYAGVTSPVAGATETVIETVSDTEVKVTRWVEVYGYEAASDMRCLVGSSPQEMLLVYEGGRWVFDSFTMWDDTSVYHNGGGLRYEYAEGIAAALIAAEAEARDSSTASHELKYFDREIVGYAENADGTVTATVRAWGYTDDGHYHSELEYTFAADDDGKWSPIGSFTLPEQRLVQEPSA